MDQVLRIDIPLEVGASTESVTITDAPAVLDTESGARGEVTSNEEIAEIPLDSRNFSDLAYLTGGALSVVTKSGSNRFRGSLYQFLRNNLSDARGFFDLEKSKLRRNQFGATFSGPVFLPKLYRGRDRTFFLVTWESLRLVEGETQRGITPLPEMLRGDFSSAVDAFGKPIKLNDLLAKAPFPGNQIPVSRMDPVAVKLAAYYPKPNLTGSANNYIAQGNATSSWNNIGIKVDHQLSSRDRLTLSTFWRPYPSGRGPEMLEWFC